MKTIENLSVIRSLPNHSIDNFKPYSNKYEYFVRQYYCGEFVTMFNTTDRKKALEYAYRLASLEPYEVSVFRVRTSVSILDINVD